MNIIDIDKFLSQEFSQLETIIKSLSNINKNDFSIELEDFMIPVFNIYFDTTFININKRFQNCEGIDLYSEKKHIAIQITVDAKAQKKRATLIQVKKLVADGKLDIDELYIFVLTSKKSNVILEENDYFKNKNILNITSILKLDKVKKGNICEYIESYYKSNFNPKFMKYKALVNDLFVETNVLEKAKKNLEEHHIAILVGHAGTGKTLNSYKILFDYIDKGYIYIQDISDIKRVLNGNQKYIFFSDDVISATDIANANYREIENAFNTADLANENFKVLLNSRINIINSYSNEHSRLGLSKFKRHYIYADTLNEIEKLRITKKHLENSYDKRSLLELFKSIEYYRESTIYRIIKHKNFNPRYIENFYKKRKETNLKLGKDILDILNNPQKIYLDAYKKLNDLEKEILKVISINNGSLRREKIFETFITKFEYEIEEALTNLDKSFLLQAELKEKVISYVFYNPSIQDFCDMMTIQSPGIERYYKETECTKAIQILLGNQRISNEVKFDVIANHPEKKDILLNAKVLNLDLFDRFRDELIDNFVEIGTIPYSYSNVLDDDTKNSIEDKFDYKKRVYIGTYGNLTNSFKRLIQNKSMDIFREDVKELIEVDFKNGIENCITEYILNTNVDYDIEQDDITYPFDQSDIKIVSDNYIKDLIYDITQEIFFCIENANNRKNYVEVYDAVFDFSGSLYGLYHLLNNEEHLKYYANFVKMMDEIIKISEKEAYEIAKDFFENTNSNNTICKSELEIEIEKFETQVKNMA